MPQNMTMDSAFQYTKPGRRMELIGAGLLTLIIIEFMTGFNPFPTYGGLAYITELGIEAPTGGKAEGSIRNQVIWGLFSAVSLGIIYLRFDRLKTILGASFPFLLLIVWCALSTLWAPDLAISFRRYIRFILLVVAALGIAVSISSPRSFLSTLVLITGLVMISNVLSVYLLPGLARDYEGSFLGMWHSQKNESGSVAAYSFIIWVTCARYAENVRSRWKYWGGAALWLLFLYNTDSKTALFVAIFVPIFSAILSGKVMKYSEKSLFFVALLFLTLIFSYFFFLFLFDTTFIDTVKFLIPGLDLTFTGRIEIWEFVIKEIANHPVIGQGFASFWGVGDQSAGVLRGSGAVTMIVQAHNGYLDIIAAIGIVGMLIFLFYYISVVRNLIRASRIMSIDKEYFILVEMITSIILATTIYNFTESTFLRSDGLIWFLFVLFGFILCRMNYSTGDDALHSTENN